MTTSSLLLAVNLCYYNTDYMQCILMYSYALQTQLLLKQIRVKSEDFQSEYAYLLKDQSCSCALYTQEFCFLCTRVVKQSLYLTDVAAISLFPIQLPSN